MHVHAMYDINLLISCIFGELDMVMSLMSLPHPNIHISQAKLHRKKVDGLDATCMSSDL